MLLSLFLPFVFFLSFLPQQYHINFTKSSVFCFVIKKLSISFLTHYLTHEKALQKLDFWRFWPLAWRLCRFYDPHFWNFGNSENPCAVGSAVRCESGVGGLWPTPFLLLLHRPKSHLLKVSDSRSLPACWGEVLLPHGCPENCSHSFFRSQCACIHAEPLNLSHRLLFRFSFALSCFNTPHPLLHTFFVFNKNIFLLHHLLGNKSAI